MPKKAFDERTYELTCLASTGYTESEVLKIQDQIAALVTKHKGSVSLKENWGKKKLAYIIKHGGSQQKEAYYLHFRLDLSSSAAVAFEKDVYLMTNIMRHLFIVAEPVKVTAAAKPSTEVETA